MQQSVDVNDKKSLDELNEQQQQQQQALASDETDDKDNREHDDDDKDDNRAEPMNVVAASRDPVCDRDLVLTRWASSSYRVLLSNDIILISLCFLGNYFHFVCLFKAYGRRPKFSIQVTEISYQ